MWHLFKHTNGKFDFAFISKGKYIAGSQQGYENRSDALKSLNYMVRKPMPAGKNYGSFLVQDDTGTKAVVIALHPREHQVLTKVQPSEKYVP